MSWKRRGKNGEEAEAGNDNIKAMPEALPSQIQTPTLPALPPHLSQAVGSLPVGERLREITERYGGGTEHARVLGEIAHGFIIGRVKAKTLIAELMERFGIPEGDARIITGELFDAVFDPISRRLKVLPPHAPPAAKPPPPPQSLSTPPRLQTTVEAVVPPLRRPARPSASREFEAETEAMGEAIEELRARRT